ncbi:MAG: MGH1-like glycoside hydrolase domain-containing protein [Acidobacteriota bacterium]
MREDLARLVEDARRVLDDNWLGDSTKPAPHLYPHQWSWDSGFIAIGYARYHQRRAQRELDGLFAAQWGNGMVPQIVFDRGALGGYFPEPDFWQAERSPHYPEAHATSGITMPPVHAMAARHVFEQAEDRDLAREWLRRLYPKLVAQHRYLYRDRDPRGEALVYLRHPWESGLDNSPVWDVPLRRFELHRDELPEYERRDLDKGIPAHQRPSDDDYDRYVWLVDLFRRLEYDEPAIRQECPFLVQDPLFNAILARSGHDLAVLGEALGEDTVQVREWATATDRAMNRKMWHELHAAYDVYDLVADEPVGTCTASGFMPLLSGAPTQEMARQIHDMLESCSFCPMHDGDCFSIPNYSTRGDFFDAGNYWRGPVWVNTNWMLARGLERYGYGDKADSVRHDIVEPVRRWGFHEYFDPFEGTGYGTDGFSWTAALFIDTAHELGGSRVPDR